MPKDFAREIPDFPKQLIKFIRDVPDFPKPGVTFRDVTPLLLNPDAFSYVIENMSGIARDLGVQMIAGIESRGFLFAAPVANLLRLPLTILRKPGKLPCNTHKSSYQLEYGEAELHVHKDLGKKKVLIIDDVLATGGTAIAACEVLRAAGCKVLGCMFLIELSYLEGRKKLAEAVRHLNILSNVFY